VVKATKDINVTQTALKIVFFLNFIVLMITKNHKNKRPAGGALLFVMTIIFITLGAVTIVSNFKINKRKSELNDRIEVLKKEIQTLEEKNAQLKAAINQTQNQDYAEQILREDLNYKKPGEDVIVIKTATDTAGGEENKTEEKSFWQKILEKLGF
jgi:cell division protein FtsB